MMHERIAILAGALALWSLQSPAAAQLREPPDARTGVKGFTPVEQRIGDVGPLRTSLRLAPLDLRVPMNFDRVYRVPGSRVGVGLPAGLNGGSVSPRGAADGSQLARVSGAITAVFPSSEYVQKKKVGVVPVVPAGTVFYIGGLPQTQQPALVRRIGPTTADTSVDTTVDSRADSSSPADLAGSLALGRSSGNPARAGDRASAVTPPRRTHHQHPRHDRRSLQAPTHPSPLDQTHRPPTQSSRPRAGQDA